MRMSSFTVFDPNLRISILLDVYHKPICFVHPRGGQPLNKVVILYRT